MTDSLKSFVQRWIINTLAVLVAAHIVSGITYTSWTGLLVATLVLGILNAFIRPLLLALSIVLVILTLGLFMIVINAVLLLIVGKLVSGFDVSGFWAAFFGSLIISVVNLVLNTLTGSGDSRVKMRKQKAAQQTPPPPRRDDGGGPVIDI